MFDSENITIEIVCTNEAGDDMVISQASFGANCAWMPDEEAVVGAAITSPSTHRWGVVMNNVWGSYLARFEAVTHDDQSGTPTGQVQLTGVGSGPVTITFSNDGAGWSTCRVQQNDEVAGMVTKEFTDLDYQVVYSVTLVRIARSRWS